MVPLVAALMERSSPKTAAVRSARPCTWIARRAGAEQAANSTNRDIPLPEAHDEIALTLGS
jgi:hypothetical protein